MAVSADRYEIPEILAAYLCQYHAFVRLLSRLANARIATLGPTGTSSEAAAHYLLEAFDVPDGLVDLRATYEDALEELLSSRSDMLLVANAYERIDAVYMQREIRLGLAFVFDTPPYGLARRPGQRLQTERPLRIATHHAPIGLLGVLMKGQSLQYELVSARSTSEAALQASRGETDLCITNVNAAAQYNVEFISKLYPIHMLWSVFVRADSETAA